MTKPAVVFDIDETALSNWDVLRRAQSRMTFAMARQVVVEITRSFRVSPSRYAGGDRLPGDEYSRMVTILLEAGIRWNDSANVEETLAALRATYEPLLDGLASLPRQL